MCVLRSPVNMVLGFIHGQVSSAPTKHTPRRRTLQSCSPVEFQGEEEMNEELLCVQIYIFTCVLIVPILIIAKWWDSHVSYLRVAFQNLSTMEDKLRRLEPLPSSERRKRWHKSVDVLRPEVSRILDGFSSHDLDYFRRSYYFGQEAVRKLKTANHLLGAGENLLRGLQRRHAVNSIVEARLAGMTDYYKEVLDFIDDEGDPSLFFGVWGMPGVGKTALLRLVRDSYTGSNNNSFNHVLLIGADTRGTMKDVQQGIAVVASASEDSATMSWHDEQQSRVYLVSPQTLQRGSFLLLLDNVPDNFDLAAAGLPIPKLGRRQKLVFTTSRRTAFDFMGCATRNTIEMRCMVEKDAWNLFKIKLGSKVIDDHPVVHELAKQMVAECRGLPLALCVIGRAMSAKRDPKEWRNACRLLKAKRSQIQQDEGYTCLDILEAQLKDAFLVTSLWPDDGSIPNDRSNI